MPPGVITGVGIVLGCALDVEVGLGVALGVALGVEVGLGVALGDGLRLELGEGLCPVATSRTGLVGWSFAGLVVNM